MYTLPQYSLEDFYIVAKDNRLAQPSKDECVLVGLIDHPDGALHNDVEINKSRHGVQCRWLPVPITSKRPCA